MSHQVRQQPMFSVGSTLTLSNSGGGIPIQTMRLSKKRLDDKKTCRWVLDNGTICGKTFSKFDSLRRHVQELHKGIRPYVCSMCDKSYGRRDYLDRHLKTHTADASGGGTGGDGSLVGGGEHSGSCSVSVSVCGEEEEDDDEDDEHDHDQHDHEEMDDDDNSMSPNLSNVVTVITTDE